MSCQTLGRALVFLSLWSIPLVPAFASRTMTITSPVTQISGDEHMTVTASASGFTDGETIYIKGAFFESGTSNYFGLTKSKDVWIKNSATNASQPAITIGDWDGTVVVKSDFSDSGYRGEGEYAFKLRFYYGSFVGGWSDNALMITINEPDPTATQIPTSTSTPTITPTATPIPTFSPHPTSTSTPTRQSTPLGKATTIRSSIRQGDFAILGLEREASQEGVAIGIPATGSGATEEQTGRAMHPAVFSLLFVGTGLGLLSTALAWKNTEVWKTLIDQKKECG